MMYRPIIAIAAVAVLGATPLAAQRTDSTARRSQWRGDLGSEGEVYNISGRDPRRPGESGQVFFNPVFTLGAVSVTGNVLLSTEGTSALGLAGLPDAGRQRLNQFGLTPRWSWGRASIGSFSESYTPLTWSGVRVDGAGLELTPASGLFRLGGFTGHSRQAVFGGVTGGSYRRKVLGSRVGVGRRAEFGTSGTFVDFVFMRVQDDPSSLPPLSDTTSVPLIPDSLAAEPDTALLPRLPLNPWAVTPQENAVLSTVAGIRLFGGAVSLTGEAAGSIHSRDQRASMLPDEFLDDYPKFLRGLVEPRVGTHADRALKGQFDLYLARLPGATITSPRSLTLSLGVQSIGAGYTSLGTPYTPNDLAGFDFRSQLRFQHWSLQVDGLSQHDNLLGQKLATTDRSQLGVSLSVQPVRSWQMLVRAATVGMIRDTDDSLGAVDYKATTLSASQAWIRGPGSRVRNVSASYSFQASADDKAAQANSAFESHNADVRVAFALGANGTITPTAGVIRSSVGDAAPTTRATYGIGADWRDASRRWVTSASASQSQVSRTSALTTRVSVRMSVTSSDQLALIARTSRYRSLVNPTLDFTEQVLSLRWSRRL